MALEEVERDASALLGRDGGLAETVSPRLSSGLVDLFGAGVLRVGTRALKPCLEPGDCPRAFPAARVGARRGAVVANLLHQAVALEPAERVLLAALDGETDRSALVGRLVAATQEGLLCVLDNGAEVTDPETLSVAFAEALPERLAALGRKGLLLS